MHETPTLDYPALAREALDRWTRDRPNLIAVDTETEGFAYYDYPFCATVTWSFSAGYDTVYESHYFELADHSAFDALGQILAGTPRWVFHNAKFDLQKLILADVIERAEVTAGRFEDTQIIAYLLDEHRRLALKVMAREILGEETDEEEALKVVRRKLKLRKDDGYHVLPREVLMPYALKDTEFTLRLYQPLMTELQQMYDPEVPNPYTLYAQEKELVLVLLDMEAKGLAVDMEYAESTAKEYGRKAVLEELTIRDLTGSEEFNPQSNPQIREAFLSRGIDKEKYDKYTLRDLDDPLAESILELRRVKKLHGTYLVPLTKEQRDGVLHPNFRYPRTKTGRLASGGVEAD